MKYDVILAGQGLAGSVLALTLIRSGYHVLVIDDPSLSSCSRVAAGIWNPVVFKRLTRSWLADEVVPELVDFYEQASKQLDVPLIHARNILKPFTELQEQQLWIKKAESGNAFLHPEVFDNLALKALKVTGPYSYVKQAGNLDVAAFLEHTRSYLKQRNAWLGERFDHQKVLFEENRVIYKDLEASGLVFCEGHLLNNNPFFNFIPLKPAKGEVLTIRCEDLELKNDILNKGIFVMPLGNNYYKVGATYDWTDRSDLPTETARQWLSDKLSNILRVPFEITAHEAGVRPSVIDRRPVVGKHPTLPGCFIFNGFGTKAVMLAPFFARQFTDFLRLQTPLHPEVDPARFYQV